MATTANSMPNARRAKCPKTGQEKGRSGWNIICYDLLACPDHLEPVEGARVREIFKEMRAQFPEQCRAHNGVIRDFALAAWRSEHFYHFKNSFCAAAIAHERAITDPAASPGQKSDEMLLILAKRRDAAGPNNFIKLFGYDSCVKEEHFRAGTAYFQALDQISQLTDIGPQELIM